eukprot:4568337-Amphidinium_carterae.1
MLSSFSSAEAISPLSMICLRNTSKTISSSSSLSKPDATPFRVPWMLKLTSQWLSSDFLTLPTGHAAFCQSDCRGFCSGGIHVWSCSCPLAASVTFLHDAAENWSEWETSASNVAIG